jgi:hypothetical protein
MVRSNVNAPRCIYFDIGWIEELVLQVLFCYHPHTVGFT